MHPKNISIADFTYLLPDDKIAKYPLDKRDESKLLIFKDHHIQQDTYANIAHYIPADSLLVFNNTRVIEARILFQKPTGGIIEIFALEPDNRYKDIGSAMTETGRVWWKCLVGGAGKWKHGQVLQKQLHMGDDLLTLNARVTGKLPDNFIIEFTWHPSTLSFAEVLHVFGDIPIPPYLKRETDAEDSNRYQTIYATHDGSVAAPTAGLHFTDKVFRSFKEAHIQTAFVTLHVGAGTFLPVKSDTLEGHSMHAEFMDVTPTFIRQLVNHPGNIFVVGTTSLRTLESLYWMGVKCFRQPDIAYKHLEMNQWEVYNELASFAIPMKQAFAALLDWVEKNGLERLVIKTQILIAPSYEVRVVSGLITNFHQPNSTLLLLVAAVVGQDWKKIYNYALENNFRFLSYGDGCLLYVS